MYNIMIELPAREELVTKWCEIKGYKTQITQISPEGEVLIANPESKEDFFKRMIESELLNIYLIPLQNYIYNEANTTANKQIEDFKKTFENALVLEITKE